MDFPENINVNLAISGISGVTTKPIVVYRGITTFLGPNGSGKTQLLRCLKNVIPSLVSGKKVRYVSAGRLGPLESYRSDYDGQRGGHLRYDQAIYGDKNAMSRRHNNETVLGDFASLSERPDILIKVQERLKKLFNRDLRIDWDGGHLRVYFTRVDIDSNEYSSAREASGLLHLVATLAAIYDDEVGCVLLDEPEVSLHPQLQSFLYQEMLKVAGNPEENGKKLIFLSTHSTEFVHLQSVDDLASIVFCSDVYEDVVQIDPSLEEFRSRKINALLSRLGQEHKLALFARRPLLVEGPSDQIICSSLSVQLGLNTEAAGSQILPVTGKGQMPIVIKLMRLIGKTPSVLADADALTDGLDLISSFTNTDEATVIATEMGHRNAHDFARQIYNDFTQLVENHWNDIQVQAELHSYWINRDADADEAIVKKRATFSTLMHLDDVVVSSLNNSAEWSQIKTRLLSLLELLGNLGCFILTKGTIENYYTFSGDISASEKPNAAAYESSHFSDEVASLETAYSDVTKAIVYAAQANEINESLAIREMVLAVITPALASITSETTVQELQISSKSLLGNRSSLFNMEVDNTDGLCLVVSLATSILDVDGFPLRIPVGSNVIETVNEQLGLS